MTVQSFNDKGPAQQAEGIGARVPSKITLASAFFFCFFGRSLPYSRMLFSNACEAGSMRAFCACLSEVAVRSHVPVRSHQLHLFFHRLGSCIWPQVYLDASCKLVLHASAFDCVSHLFKPKTPQRFQQLRTMATQDVALRYGSQRYKEALPSTTLDTQDISGTGMNEEGYRLISAQLTAAYIHEQSTRSLLWARRISVKFAFLRPV